MSAVCAACGAVRSTPDHPSCQTCGADGDELHGDTKPMTRTELAMLWDLLGQWHASHDHPRRASARLLRDMVDDELAERFGS